MQTITPFLWFDGNAEEAMNHYASIFKDSKMGKISRLPNGRVMSVAFQLNGQDFMALNGGPHFQFTEAISMFVRCETQEEVDELWEKLSEGGKKGRCGWLKDKFGLSWQIVPQVMGELLGHPDPATAKRVMDAMMTMDKIDVRKLEEARDHR
jgi:predicted 3-demethylubiquinone-9 3-methyltransferase (glyoxalase superfamily)